MQHDSTAPVPPEADDLPALPFIPLRRQRYTLTHLHGAGGIGRVWLARDDQVGRDVALKELRGDKAHDAAHRAYFLREARITGQLEHPNIVPVYELAERPDNQQPFYVMRLVKGRTLREAAADYHAKRVRGEAGPLDLAALLQAFVAVCNAVAYAHARGVIHRDLKGDNVVLGEFGEVIVLDWGLAKELGGDKETRRKGENAPDSVSLSPCLPVSLSPGPPEQTTAGQVLGTPAYMAPEQATGQTDRIGRHTDVYGLGALLYQVLTGQPPFAGDGAAEVLRRVRDEEPARPRRHNRAVPAALEAVCLRALAKRPEDRYPSAAELARDVQRWLADEPVRAYREPVTARAARWARRHRTMVAGVAGLLLAAVAALAVGVVILDQKNQAIAEEKRKTEEKLSTVLQVLNDTADYVVEHQELLRDFPQVNRLGHGLIGLVLTSYREDFERARQTPGLREQFAGAYSRLGRIYELLRMHAEAEDAYTEVIAFLTEKAAQFPTEREYLRALARNHGQLARFLLRRKRAPEAETQFRLAIEVQERLARQPTGTRDDWGQLAWYHYELGLRFHDHGQHAESEPSMRQAVAIQQRLADTHPDQHAYRNHLATCLYRLSIVLRAQGQTEEAERLVQQVLALRRQLTEQFADTAEYHYEFAWFLHHRGRRLRQAVATRPEARGLLEEAAGHQHRALRLSPHHRTYRRLLHDIYEDLTLTLLALGDHAAAARAAEEMPRALPDSWEPCRRAAGLLVRCMQGADKDAALTAAARRLRREVYADQSVNLLQAAVRRGFDKLADLREDKNWAPLHNHPEFRLVTGGAP